MPERPLLLFLTPQPADRKKQKRQFGPVHKPNATRQGQRLSPMFNQLQAAFEARRVEIQQNTAGIDPEQVLVIETIGSVDNFANAVKRIDGLEWMGELESDEIAPDQKLLWMCWSHAQLALPMGGAPNFHRSSLLSVSANGSGFGSVFRRNIPQKANRLRLVLFFWGGDVCEKC